MDVCFQCEDRIIHSPLCSVPGSPQQPQCPCSPAPTKTRSTLSPPARPSVPSNCLAPCPPPLRTARAGPPHSTAPPHRCQRAPAQTTRPRRPAHPQRLPHPRQTAPPSARPQSTSPQTEHHRGSLSVQTPSNPPPSLHDVATMSPVTTFTTATEGTSQSVYFRLLSHLLLT